jgi:hypothetical protein
MQWNRFTWSKKGFTGIIITSWKEELLVWGEETNFEHLKQTSITYTWLQIGAIEYIALVRFTTSCHSLRLVDTTTPPEDRLCKFCNSGTVDDKLQHLYYKKSLWNSNDSTMPSSLSYLIEYKCVSCAMLLYTIRK